jgi:hypothetical protein
VGLGVVTAFGFLFMRSLHDTTTTAYTAERQHLRSWTLVLEPASRPNDPLLALRPTPELASGLFHQVFSRTMESLNAPVAPAVPLVLRGEFDRLVGDQLTQDAACGRPGGGARDGGHHAPLPRAPPCERARWNAASVLRVL